MENKYMMNDNTWDGHIHTTLSDGVYTEEEIVKMAINMGLRSIVFTDHNKIHDIERLQLRYPNLHLISGSEISAHYFTMDGKKKEIHIVGMFLERTPQLLSFLEANNDDGRERVEKILQRLRECNIFLHGSSWEEFRDWYFSGRSFIGRSQIAEAMQRDGFCSFEEAMDNYLGSHNQGCPAYVESTHEFADIRKVIQMIHEAGKGIAVLAHPLSYGLSDIEIVRLVEMFVQEGGDAVECLYSGYSEKSQMRLSRLAESTGLLQGCGSDFHGNRGQNEKLGCFSESYLERLRNRWQEIRNTDRR